MTEIYKIKNNYSPPIKHNLFQVHKNILNLRNFRELVNHNKKTLNFKNFELEGTVCLG